MTAASPPSSPARGRRWLPREMRTSAMAMAFVAGLAVLASVAVGVVLVIQRRAALDAELAQNTNLARVIEEQTLRVLATTDQATMRVRDAVVARPADIPDLVRLANETGLVPRILVQLSVVDAQGRLVASNLDPDGTKSGHVDLTEREHVRAHLSAKDLPPDAPPLAANGLFIGKPVLGKVSKRWTIQLSRKISGPDGRTLGVVVASLDPGYFDEVFQRVSIGPQGGVAMVGSDRTIRARVIGGKSAGVGTLISEASPIAQGRAGAEGNYPLVSPVDGVERIAAYRRVADYPLYVLVLTSVDEALGAWRGTLKVAIALTSVLCLALGLSAAGFVLGMRRLERTNAALRASEAQAQAANQAKSEFLAAISHELRTPLTSIRGFAELMEHRLENERFRETAGLIRKGAEHLNKLLSEILDLAKTEAGAMVLVNGPVEVRTLVNEAAEFFALAAQDKGLALSVKVQPEVPPAISGDALRLKQILSNLLSNAVMFTPQGSVAVDVELVRKPKGPSLLVHVQDTGPGMTPEVQAIIFDKFRQGSAHVSYEHGGTGLGLALSRGLAELMKGSLTVSSTPGRGSRFTLEVPALPAGFDDPRAGGVKAETEPEATASATA